MKIHVYRLTMVFLCVAGIFFTGQSVQARELVVTIPGEVTVSGLYCTLGDVADISGDDAERIDNLRQIRLGNVPQPGQSYVLTAELVMGRIRAAHADISGIDWQLPPQLKVTAAAQSISGRQLVAQAEQYIKANISGEASITAASQPSDVLAPPGELSYRLSLPYGIRYNTPTSVRLEVLAGGQHVTALQLRFEIKKYQQVVIAGTALNAGDKITVDSVNFERYDIGRLPPGYFTGLDKILGLTAKRQIAPGAVITESMLGKAVLIKRGQPVSIVAKIGGIEATAPGIALQDGREGEVIRVKNTNSQKVVSGQVTDMATVQVNS